MISQSVPRIKISTHLINPVLPEAKEFLHVFYSHSLFLYLVLRDRRKALGGWAGGKLRSIERLSDNGNELKCITFGEGIHASLCHGVMSTCSYRYTP